MAPPQPPIEDTLQIGVEFEFISPPAPSSAATFGNRNPSSTYVAPLHRQQCFQMLAQAMNDKGLPSGFELHPGIAGEPGPFPEKRDVHATNPNVVGIFKYFDVERLQQLNYEENRVIPQHWIIKQEWDVEQHGERVQWHGVELNSPILRQSEVESGSPNIRMALDALFSAHPQNTFLSPKCGLHVHIMPVGGLYAIHIKRIATVLWMLDDNLLFHLCSPIRPQANGAVTSTCRFGEFLLADDASYNPQPSPEMRANMPEGLWNSAPLAFHSLWSSQSVPDLYTGLNTKPSVKPFKFSALQIKTHDDNSMTMEFRHAQGSFSHEFVHNWIALVFTVSKLAFIPQDEFKRAAQKMWEVVSSNPHPSEAWRPLLRILAAAMPTGWRCTPDEGYWSSRLDWMEECRRKGEDEDAFPDGSARVD